MEAVRTGQQYVAQQRIYRLILYVLLLAGCAIMLLPFFWMLTTSFKTETEALRIPPQWIPVSFRWQNYVEAWNAAPFGWYFFNSFFMAITTTLGEVFTTILAATTTWIMTVPSERHRDCRSRRWQVKRRTDRRRTRRSCGKARSEVEAIDDGDPASRIQWALDAERGSEKHAM